MTAKEKAEELVERFKPFSYYDGHDLTTRKRREESNIESAVECALIAVDEILAALTDYGEENDELQNMESDFRFYEKVKSEIENL